MSRQEAVEQYARALKRGRKLYKDCLIRGRYPYPQVLDEILDNTMVAGQVDMGVKEIPMDQLPAPKQRGGAPPLRPIFSR